MQVQALVLLEDSLQRQITAMQLAPWYRVVSLLLRCCPRLDLAAYIEECSTKSVQQQMVRTL